MISPARECTHGNLSLCITHEHEHTYTRAVSASVVLKALVDNVLPALETELALELKAAARATVVEEASRALARRLAVGPYEREELSVFQKMIKADSELKYDQVSVVGSKFGYSFSRQWEEIGVFQISCRW